MRGDKHRFKRVWRSPPETLAFIKSKFKGRVLNLCAGESMIGDVNVDREPLIHGIIKADVLGEEFDLGEKFDTVYSDPPWNWPYDIRHKFQKTVIRHLKVGGLYILHAPWMPNLSFEPLEMYVAHTVGGLPKNISLITVAKLSKGVYDSKRTKFKLHKPDLKSSLPITEKQEVLFK